MKAKIYFVLIIGFFFWHPRYTFADAKQDSFISHSLEKVLQESPVIVDDSQNSNAFFSGDIAVNVYADLDFDDDDDVSFSTRKKISFEETTALFFTKQSLQQFSQNTVIKYWPAHSGNFPHSNFISLRVFRL